MTKPNIITLTTDFGVQDGFVGTMKGVMLSINPTLALIDICHEITRHDVHSASYVVFNSYQFFPKRTVHMVVVDPGVGSDRNVLIASFDDHYFVAPDNGVLKYIFHSNKEKNIYRVTNEEYFSKSISNTFHGRDVFSPLAANLSLNKNPDRFGKITNDFVEGKIPELKFNKNNIRGCIEYVDIFGNLITNIPNNSLDNVRFQLKLGRYCITSLHQSYSEGNENEPVLLKGSNGKLEIAINLKSAQQVLKLCTFDMINIELIHTV